MYLFDLSISNSSHKIKIYFLHKIIKYYYYYLLNIDLFMTLFTIIVKIAYSV